MKDQYTIQNIQLTRLANFRLTEDAHYIVCWWNKLPLGHFWYESGNKSFNLKKSINNAICGAVDYYSDKFCYDKKDLIAQLLEQSNYAAIAQCFDEGNLNQLWSTQQQRLSVVICTRNRTAALKRCLESFQRSTDQDFELIIVDNDPDDDGTRFLVASFPEVIYFREPRRGLDIARNAGAKIASCDIVAYTDDDVIIPVDWIHNIKTCFNDPLTMAVTGLVLPFELTTRAQVIFEQDWSFNKGFIPTTFDHGYFMKHLPAGVPAWEIGAGANMAFRKNAFYLAGYFDERLDVGASGCSGDSEMWYRIMAEGWNCVYQPHLYVFHQHRTTMAGLRGQLFNYLRGHVSALLVQHENYQHQSNTRRAYKGFLQYFYTRFKTLVYKEQRQKSFLFSEMKGYLSGLRFYKKNKDNRRYDIHVFPQDLLLYQETNHSAIVTVVIPAYNHARYLPTAIDSVLNQTHEHIDIVVVDDGSDDETEKVCEAYGQKIKYVKVHRVGLSAARNIGVKYGVGQFMVFLDADDFLLPTALETNLSKFIENHELAFVSGGHIRVDNNGDTIASPCSPEKKSQLYWSLLHGNYIAMQATVMYRKELFSFFYFDTQLLSCEDYDFNLAIANHFNGLSHSEVVAAYRIHNQNMSGKTDLMLHSALRVLSKQEKKLSNEGERDAFHKGRWFWTNHYTATANQ